MEFEWENQHDETEGDRKLRRQNGRENKKLRRKARRLYIEKVRSLVDFVKKRDKRLILYKMERHLEKAKKKEQERENKRAKEREKAERGARAYKERNESNEEEVEINKEATTYEEHNQYKKEVEINEEARTYEEHNQSNIYEEGNMSKKDEVEVNEKERTCPEHNKSKVDEVENNGEENEGGVARKHKRKNFKKDMLTAILRTKQEAEKKEQEREKKRAMEKEKAERGARQKPSYVNVEELEDDKEVEEEGSVPIEEFYCVACKKIFKSQNQWKNHERSKKHKQNMKF